MSEKTVKSELLEWVQIIVVGLILALLTNKFILFVAEIPSVSMVPTLNVNDRLLVRRIYNFDKLERQDIIVFDCKEEDSKYIKRLIGLPGDKISIKDGQVYVNGELLKEDYVKNKDMFTGEYEVPEGKYFFLGDNRSDSKDSRYLKTTYIDEEDIVGKAFFKIYPFDDFGVLN